MKLISAPFSEAHSPLLKPHHNHHEVAAFANVLPGLEPLVLLTVSLDERYRPRRRHTRPEMLLRLLRLAWARGKKASI